MSFLDCIELQFNHVKRGCGERGQGKRVSLKGVDARRVVVDGDALIGGSDKSCDCIIFVSNSNEIALAVVELKSSLSHVKAIVSKLKECAAIAEEMLAVCNQDRLKVNFYPVLYFSGRMDISNRKVLRDNKNKIHFMGKAYLIEYKEYKIPLAQVISHT